MNMRSLARDLTVAAVGIVAAAGVVLTVAGDLTDRQDGAAQHRQTTISRCTDDIVPRYADAELICSKRYDAGRPTLP